MKRRKREPVALLLAAAESRVPASVPPAVVGRKGLRHFAIRVSKKVQEKTRANSSTTYIEIADELIAEEKDSNSNSNSNNNMHVTIDEKNIRRRVYDSLNVLIALGAIRRTLSTDTSGTTCNGASTGISTSGDKKCIRWVGLQSEECARIRDEVGRIRTVLRKKKERLKAIEEQVRALDRLVARNRAARTSSTAFFLSSGADTESEQSNGGGNNTINNNTIKLPFLVLATHRSTFVNIDAADAANRIVNLALNRDFTIMDDREILRKLKLEPDINLNMHGSMIETGNINSINSNINVRSTPTFPTGLMSNPATPPSARRRRVVSGSGGSGHFLPLGVMYSPSKSLSLTSTPRRNFLATPPRFPAMVMDTEHDVLGFTSFPVAPVAPVAGHRRILPLPPPPPPSDDDHSSSSQYQYRNSNSNNLLKRVLVPNLNNTSNIIPTNNNNNNSSHNTPTYRGGSGSLLGLSRI